MTLARRDDRLPRDADESWFQSFYRAVVTVTLTGLDSVPASDGARVVSIVLVAAGLTIIAYAGAVIVEAIAGGVLTGALAERRRERTIQQLHDHFIICGYGRVGRRVAEEFRAAASRYLVVDFHEDAVEAAQEDGVLARRGRRDAGREPPPGGPRARAGARRRLRLRRRQPLRRALGPLGAPRPDDRRARVRRRRRAEAAPRRRRPRRAAVHDRGPGDGEPRAQAAGHRLPRRRDDGHRPRPPARGDRGAPRRRGGGADDPRAPHPPRDRRDRRRAAEARTAASTRRRSRTRRSRSATS